MPAEVRRSNRGSPRRITAAIPGALRRAPRRLSALTWGELRLLAQAPVVLPAVAFALRRKGLRPVQTWLARRPPRRVAPHDPHERLAEAERLAWCVAVVAAYGPWPANCLHRSVTLWWFLRRRGLQGDLRIGVRRDRDRGELDFHAWVEHAGTVVGDRRDVRERYATFDQAIAPADASFS